MTLWLTPLLAAILAAAVAYLAGARRAGLRGAKALDASTSEFTRQMDELRSLQELGLLLSESLDVDQIVTRAVRFVHESLLPKGTMAAILQVEGPPLRVIAAEGNLEHLSGVDFDDPESGALAIAMGRERLVVIEDEHGPQTEMLPGLSIRRGLIAPLHAHGETLGAIAVVTDPDRPIPAEHQRLLAAATTHTALVLANARFFEMMLDAKEQWETTFDALKDGIAVLDRTHRVRRANRALVTLVGQSGPSIAGSHLCELLFGGQPDLENLLEEMERDDAPRSATARSEPLERTLRVTVSPMRGTLQEEGWAAVLVEDVTEWQAMEARLIQNERMVAVGQLVSGVAHELNNPLTSISGLAEFLTARHTLPTAEHEHLAVIREQAERANKIVNNLLTFARQGPDEIVQLEFAGLVKRVALLMTYDLKLQQIALETNLDQPLPPVAGDRFQLQQVIINLVTNAVQAVLQGPESSARRVALSTGTEDGRVYLRVTDSGPGILPEDLPHIFMPFFTTKDPGRGTGLGLSISFRIVEGHGGQLWVEQTGPSGTTFRVELPASTDTAAPGPEGESRGHDAVSGILSETPGRRILLVDSDPAVQRMIKTIFLAEGQMVDAVSTAEPAVERLENRRYDLIIAEPRTAVSPGETFADLLLRRWPELASRTILVTGDVREETARWLDGLGCRYFRKPFNVREFLSTAAKVFAEHN